MEGLSYSENPAMFRNNPLGFVLSILLIPAFGLGLLILLYWYAATKAAKLSVDASDVLFEKGLLSKERSELRIRDIRTVRVKQSFSQRIFGTGTIEIFTAGDKPEISVSGLPRPHEVRELVKGIQANE